MAEIQRARAGGAYAEEVPLYERLKFIAIFTSNLDEFFMVRVGSLYDMSLDGDDQIDNKTGLSPSQQLERIYHAWSRSTKSATATSARWKTPCAPMASPT